MPPRPTTARRWHDQPLAARVAAPAAAGLAALAVGEGYARVPLFEPVLPDARWVVPVAAAGIAALRWRAVAGRRWREEWLLESAIWSGAGGAIAWCAARWLELLGNAGELASEPALLAIAGVAALVWLPLLSLGVGLAAFVFTPLLLPWSLGSILAAALAHRIAGGRAPRPRAVEIDPAETAAREHFGQLGRRELAATGVVIALTLLLAGGELALALTPPRAIFLRIAFVHVLVVLLLPPAALVSLVLSRGRWPSWIAGLGLLACFLSVGLWLSRVMST